MRARIPRWSEVVCLASGPSLTASDCELVREWRARAPGRGVIVVNTTFRLAPWADVLFAMDAKWWEVTGAEAQATFAGELLTNSNQAPIARRIVFDRARNSGACAIALARHYGAKRIILLGYDCQKTGGKTHWHGSHPAPLGDAGSMPKWDKHFRQVALLMRGVAVLNCSRETALTCFPRANLEDALQ